jgi:hypothetical protein
MLVQAVPVLLPELLSIVSKHEQYWPDIRRWAFLIVHSIINMLSNLSGQELKQVHSMLAPLLPPWFEQFGQVLGSSADVQVSVSEFLHQSSALQSCVGITCRQTCSAQ